MLIHGLLTVFGKTQLPIPPDRNRGAIRRQDVSGWKAVDILEQRLGAGVVAVEKVLEDRLMIELLVHQSGCQNRSQGRAENQPLFVSEIEEGLHAEVVASEDELLVFLVPQSKGKLAVHTIQKVVRGFLVEVGQCFPGAACTESAAGTEMPFELLDIVYFPLAHHHDGVIAAEKGLRILIECSYLVRGPADSQVLVGPHHRHVHCPARDTRRGSQQIHLVLICLPVLVQNAKNHSNLLIDTRLAAARSA